MSAVMPKPEQDNAMLPVLAGKRALVIGVANDQSIAYGCARAFSRSGAKLAVTYLNDKAKPHVESAVAGLAPELFMPCDVQHPGQLEAVFGAIQEQWGGIDIVLHSIAFAPREDLHGRLTDCSREGFLAAMDISCHSFLHMARLARPLMKHNGGTLITMSYYGAEKVVPNYGVMGPVKAALEACVRYMAAELGPEGIRVHAVSPGPLKTRAASGIADFDALLAKAAEKAPLHTLVDIHDVGAATAFLASDYAKHMTGQTIYVDAGYHVLD